jgi:hypothetical protein
LIRKCLAKLAQGVGTNTMQLPDLRLTEFGQLLEIPDTGIR